MSNQKHLYVVFSSTKCGMGSFVRFMTHNPYNHLSLSLDRNLGTLYSFARHYKSAPLYGGFVCESCLRYKSNSSAQVKVAAIPLTDKQYEAATEYFENIKKGGNRYIYNTLSAITNLFHRKVKIKDAFTCVEFAVSTIDNLGLDKDISANRFYSIKQLEAILADRITYEGVFPDWADCSDWGNDTYNLPMGFFKGSKNTIHSYLRLLKRLATAE